MQSYTFQLFDDRDVHIAQAVLMLRDERSARSRAAVHLSACPHFSSVKILQDERLVCALDRTALDLLSRPTARAAGGRLI